MSNTIEIKVGDNPLKKNELKNINGIICLLQ